MRFLLLSEHNVETFFSISVASRPSVGTHLTTCSTAAQRRQHFNPTLQLSPSNLHFLLSEPNRDAFSTGNSVASRPSQDFSDLKKIVFVCVILVSLSLLPFSTSIVAARQPHASAYSSQLQLLKQSEGMGLGGKSAATDEAISDKSSRKTIYEHSVRRVRRTGWNSSEKNRPALFHDQGTNNAEHNSFSKLSEGSHQDELRSREVYLILAQQEAQCLQEFGELEPGISFEFPQDLFQPIVCLPGSQNFSACVQCNEMIQKVRVGEAHSQVVNCQQSCRVGSALPNCIERCAEVVRSLIDIIQQVRDGAASGKSKWNAEGRCNEKECSLKTPTTEVNREGDATGEIDNNADTLTSDVFCEGASQPLPKIKTTSHAVLNKGLQNQARKSNYRHFVYLKSLFSNGGNRTTATKTVPIVFLVEQRESEMAGGGLQRDSKGNWTSWRVLGKSAYGFDKIQVAYRHRAYEWRVTAVGVHGPLAVSIVKSFITLDGYMEPGPPRRIFLIENQPKESTVDVLLGWDPPQERACFYKIVLETRNDEESSRTVRIKGEPSGVHKVWFRGLKLDSIYEVRITSRSAEWHEDESTHASLSFTTPACLDAHQFRFDKCAPPPPRNLSYKVLAVSSSKVTDVLGNPTPSFKRHFTAQLMWQPPAHASGTNLILRYSVDIRAFSWNAQRNNINNTDIRSELTDPQQLLAPMMMNLSGNVTHVKLDNLDAAAEYTVLVSAVSSKGASPAATLTVKLHSEMRPMDTTMGYWIYPCGVFVSILVVASGCHAAKTISTRRKIKAARDSYFKSIDQRDAYVGDWSVVSLTEDANSTWKVLEENSIPKDKWHVGFQDLTIGDIIGQGAFGIVRKAQIKSDKFLELQKRHNKKTFDSNYQVCSSKLGDDETGMETVALKMLKVAAAKTDREDLMKELMTMQSLGMHPQIVTLLGVCTTPKSMYLVLEYCPGGDLLSFLRKFREKHLPLLNLQPRSGTGTGFVNSGYQSLFNEDCLMNLSSSGIVGEREHVSYTDLQHNDTSASSPELSDVVIQPVAKMEIETGTSVGSEEGTSELERISEKDVLSYARQVALGMTYLERNHIIHRDLACRNVLVMGDTKRVKISDFGLSRDIYTWNVYQQKTAGKMPFKWMALESITSRVFTSKSDVWSYGIVLWELVTLGAVPYPTLENQELLKMLRTGYRMEQPDNCSEELYALMRKCWRTAPADRPSFIELISYLETMMDTQPELYLTLQP